MTLRSLFLPAALALLFSCNRQTPKTDSAYITIEGQAMGTYYRVTYADSLGRDFQPQVEQFLEDFNTQVSTYLDTSLISRFNLVDNSFTIPVKPAYFLDNLLASREVNSESEGAFDPTVMPLVTYWGFGVKPREVSRVDSLAVDSLRQFVGIEKVRIIPKGADSVILQKAAPGVQLDFNAIAQGDGVDEVAKILEQNGVVNYLIDIGGEMLGKGVNARGEAWTIGINTPVEDGQTEEIFTTVPLDNRALATSGNYRKFYEVDGVKYSHTINPKTGYPERSTLLSASVFAPTAMIADAYATACMVLGAEKGMAMIERLPDLEAVFIVAQPDGSMALRYSGGLGTYFKNRKK